MRCDHPDIEDFLKIKQNNDKIKMANISILFTHEFMRAVLANEDYKLHFFVPETGEHIERTINAKDFFHKFCENNFLWAEPGSIFIDRVNNYHILSGYPKDEYHIDISNPCAEFFGNAYNSCLTGDTNVLTPGGVRQLKEMVGSSGFVYSTNGKFEEYDNVVSNGVKEVYTVTLKGGHTLKATVDHKFFTNNGWKKLSDLDLKHDTIFVNKKQSIIPYDSYDEKFEMLGWMHGDGWCSSSVGISFNKKDGDFDVMDRLLPYFQKEFNCENVKPLKKDTESYQLQTASKIAMNKCKEIGFVPSKAAGKELPLTFFKWTLKEQISFIRGLLTADGFVGGVNNSKIEFCSTSEKLVKQVQNFLFSLGIHSSEFVTVFDELMHRKPQYRIDISGIYAARYFDIFGFSGKTKTEKYQKGNIDRISNYLEIKNITKCGKEEVFDILNVNSTNAFFANGIGVHNCNLGSINLYNCINNPFTPVAELDRNKLDGLIRLGVRALNEVLDYGYDSQPLEENRECINDWRSIGLGVFGLADALVAMGLRYGSEESIAFIHLIGSCLKNGALRASSDYALERGTFNMYDEDWIYKSKYIKHAPDGVKEMIHLNGLANGTLLSIAPTGTISTMCGHTGGIEPIYQVAYERTTHTLQNEGNGQTFKIYAKSVWDLLKHDGIDPDSVSIDEIKAKYPYVVDTYDIDPIDRVRVQATLQEYVDNAISSTINMKHDSTVEDVENVYLEAWKQGCKGITIFRDGCKRFSILGKDKPEENVEIKPETTEKVADETKLDCLEPHKRGNIHSLWGKTFVYKTACVRKFYVTVNCMDNDIFEVFVGADTGCQANINTITRLTSYALRLGGKVDDIIKELNSAICPACSHLIRNGNIEYNKSCASCIADALKEMQSILWSKGKAEGHMMFLDHLSEKIVETITPEPLSEVNLDTTKHNDMFECPECHQKTLKPEGKCATCSNCGYSKCG